MRKSLVLAVVLLLGTTGYVTQAVAQESVESLRGATPIEADDTAPEIKRLAQDREPIERDYLQQPPLIPHKISAYRINLKTNKCLTCHSWQTYRKAGATKISQTHFKDRELDSGANVAARRYFCTQCHVPQVDAPPLIENTFDSVDAMKRK